MNYALNYVRVAAANPTLQISNPKFNAKAMIETAKKAVEKGVDILTFPELSLTGYTCADIFHQRWLYQDIERALSYILRESKCLPILMAIGIPILADNQLFNCAVMVRGGELLGVVPKTYIPNYNEFYESRWFSSSTTRLSDTITLCNQTVPFSTNLLFKDEKSDAIVGVEICEDVWVNIPPSSIHTLYGANIILNLSASTETIGKADYRRQLIKGQSSRCVTAYVYASASQQESTTDIVMSGHCMIAENGTLLADSNMHEEGLFMADIDLDVLTHDRINQTSYMGNVPKTDYQIVSYASTEKDVYFSRQKDFRQTEIIRPIIKHPFVPNDSTDREHRCQEIIQLQATGLYQRMKKIGSKKAILGISGGLDSTLALLVTLEAFKKLGYEKENIIGITMPGFGTSKQTKSNSIELMKELGITSKTIDITAACKQHFSDIGHDESVHDVTYENVQARERTQILMDLANQEKGMVIGTGDLSELALGWCTYNGDHMSMYGVNVDVPKTLVRYLILSYASMLEKREDETDKRIAEILKDICDTPISPELLPLDEDGKIVQKTENSIGSYDLNDFILYHMLRYGFSAYKIQKLARQVFRFSIDEVENGRIIDDGVKNFFRRFYTAQFKRSCLPDGVKIGSVCLSPRGDFRCPSDITWEAINAQLERNV